jgi:hypothetical protein
MERLRGYAARVRVPRRLLALGGLMLGAIGSCTLPKINPHL